MRASVFTGVRVDVLPHEDDEYLKSIGQEIRAGVSARDQPDIDGAVGWINRVLRHVVTSQLGRPNPAAEAWAADRLRAMLVLVQAPQWFRAWELDTVPNEFGERLIAEWLSLVAQPAQYGPGHLIAWIWLLNRRLTEPLVDGFMRQVTPILKEAVAQNTGASDADWRSQMMDWASFVRSNV